MPVRYSNRENWRIKRETYHDINDSGQALALDFFLIREANGIPDRVQSSP
jgi:hypothetical protein